MIRSMRRRSLILNPNVMAVGPCVALGAAFHRNLARYAGGFARRWGQLMCVIHQSARWSIACITLPSTRPIIRPYLGTHRAQNEWTWLRLSITRRTPVDYVKSTSFHRSRTINTLVTLPKRITRVPYPRYPSSRPFPNGMSLLASLFAVVNFK